MPISKPFLGIQLNHSHPLAYKLVGCWLFNEGNGNIATDLSGNANHGTLTTMTQADWIAGRDGYALDFDGASDHIECGPSNVFDISGATGYWSSEVWINTTTNITGADGAIICKIYESGSHGTYDKAIELTVNEFANIHVYDGANKEATGSVSLANGLWHQIIGTFTGSNIQLYVDGLYVTQTAASQTFNFTTPIFNIGHDSAGTSEYFAGKIGLVRLYQTNLSAANVLWLYRNPYAMFETLSPPRFFNVPAISDIVVLRRRRAS